MEDKSWMCVLCGNHFVGWGNNPEPVRSSDWGQCCTTCNETVVIPARLASASASTPTELTFDGGTWGVVDFLDNDMIIVLDEDGGEHELTEARID